MPSPDCDQNCNVIFLSFKIFSNGAANAADTASLKNLYCFSELYTANHASLSPSGAKSLTRSTSPADSST